MKIKMMRSKRKLVLEEEFVVLEQVDRGIQVEFFRRHNERLRDFNLSGRSWVRARFHRYLAKCPFCKQISRVILRGSEEVYRRVCEHFKDFERDGFSIPKYAIFLEVY